MAPRSPQLGVQRQRTDEPKKAVGGTGATALGWASSGHRGQTPGGREGAGQAVT